MQQQSWFRILRRWRFPISAAFDSLLWFIALYAAALARLNFEPSALTMTDYVGVAAIAVFSQLVSGISYGLYRGTRPIASFDEVVLIAASTVTAGAVAAVIVSLAGTPRLLPLSAILAATAYQMLGALGIRYAARLAVELNGRSAHPRNHRTIVFGAGEAGRQIVWALLRDRVTDLDPVALLDDDRTKKRLKLSGIPVVGGRDDIARTAERYGADTFLLAIPSASQTDLNHLAGTALDAGLTVKVLPLIGHLAEPSVRDIRDIEMADFLGRDEIDIDIDSVGAYITDKRVLVTGAGGSIGSELCRTIKRFKPAQLVMVDHNENALHALQVSLEGHGLLTSPGLVLCDIRDREAIQSVFDETQPQVVFHAAAHKHVTFLERFPSEGYKTNVEGSRNVLDAATAAGVERYVNVSTDKAADPISVLGKTKREAELLTASQNEVSNGLYLSVRFGNVLGSSGSIVPTFVEQIRNGDPVTVTDPMVTRFFMTVEESVLLLLQAGALGEGGDVLVMDMGEPIKIVDIAMSIAQQMKPGEPLNIVFSGLRDGEKLHEVLTSTADTPLSQPHPRLQRFKVETSDVSSVEEFLRQN